jgi:hypothetical protein
MWWYEDQDGRHCISEDAIIVQYWDFWYQKMVKKYGVNSDLITRENCIEDWAVTNYAWKE